jgi:hypothetical protein
MKRRLRLKKAAQALAQTLDRTPAPFLMKKSPPGRRILAVCSYKINSK